MTPNSPRVVVNDIAWAHELEKGVETYLDMLLEAAGMSDDETVAETVSGEMFCGCSACFWRESLMFLIPRVIVGYEEGKLELED